MRACVNGDLGRLVEMVRNRNEVTWLLSPGGSMCVEVQGLMASIFLYRVSILIVLCVAGEVIL